jgi:hypothetical protein
MKVNGDVCVCKGYQYCPCFNDYILDCRIVPIVWYLLLIHFISSLDTKLKMGIFEEICFEIESVKMFFS